MKKGKNCFFKFCIIVMGIFILDMFAAVGIMDVCAKEGDVKIDKEHFPDRAFRTYVKKNIAQGRDVLTKEECEAVISITIEVYVKGSGHDITKDEQLYHTLTNVEGIQYFTNLRYLDLIGTNLKELDCTKCLNVAFLTLDSNKLRRLTLPEGNKLEYLLVSNNTFVQLEVKEADFLRGLSLYYCELESLRLPECPQLKSVGVLESGLSSLDVSKCPKLENLGCAKNNLANLDVSKNPQLETLDCSDNVLESLDLTGNLFIEAVYCKNNKLETLDVSTCQNLAYLYLDGNQIKDINLDNQNKLITLSCKNNMLTAINLTNCVELKRALLGSNRLTALTVEKNTKLEALDYSDNCIKERVDLSACRKLNEVWAYGNKGQRVPDDVKNISVKKHEKGSITCIWEKVKCNGYKVDLDDKTIKENKKDTSIRIGAKKIEKGVKYTVTVTSYKKIGKTFYYGRPATKTFIIK